jgi:hypothetical protein
MTTLPPQGWFEGECGVLRWFGTAYAALTSYKPVRSPYVQSARGAVSQSEAQGEVRLTDRLEPPSKPYPHPVALVLGIAIICGLYLLSH